MDENSDGFGAFLSGFLLGALIGGAAALLLAPQTGEETRILIKDKSIELKDKTSEKAEEVALKTKESASGLQQRGQVVLDKQKIRFGKKDVEAEPVEAIELSDDDVEVDLEITSESLDDTES